jgi:hypothetical protein
MQTELMRPPSKETVERVRGEFGLNEGRVREAVEHLKDWLQLQPHLPKEIGKLRISATAACSFHCWTQTRTAHKQFLSLRGISPPFKDTILFLLTSSCVLAVYTSENFSGLPAPFCKVVTLYIHIDMPIDPLVQPS